MRQQKLVLRYQMTPHKKKLLKIDEDSKHRPHVGLYEMGLDYHKWFESKKPHIFKCPHCGRKIEPKDVTINDR